MVLCARGEAFPAGGSLVVIPILVGAQNVVASSERHGDHRARLFGERFELCEQSGPDPAHLRIISRRVTALNERVTLSSCGSEVWKIQKMAATAVNLPIFDDLTTLGIWTITEQNPILASLKHRIMRGESTQRKSACAAPEMASLGCVPALICCLRPPPTAISGAATATARDARGPRIRRPR
jgi:hypothetical protein